MTSPNSPPPGAPLISNGPPPPRIPLSWASVSEQRFYTIALILASQAFKLTDSLANLIQPLDPTSPEIIPTVFVKTAGILSSPWISWLTPLLFGKAAKTAAVGYLVKWFLLDLGLILGIRWLRIPGLGYTGARAGIMLGVAVLINSFIFGSFNVTGYVIGTIATTYARLMNPHGRMTTLSGQWQSPAEVILEKGHLSGGKIVHLLPYGTAVLNPRGFTYCLTPNSKDVIRIPLITNSSTPSTIEYYVQSLEDPSERQDYVISGKFDAPAKSRVLALQRIGRGHFDEEDEEDDDEESMTSGGEFYGDAKTSLVKASIKADETEKALPSSLEKDQTIYYLKVDKPGLVQVTRIVDEDGAQFRLRAMEPALVVECPSKGIVWMEGCKPADQVRRSGHAKVEPESRCTGQEDVVEMLVQGVGSMKVDWTITQKNGNSKVLERGAIEGIEAASLISQALIKHDPGSMQLQRYHSRATPAQPHTVSLPIRHDKPGLFEVDLHTVSDSLGNEFKPPEAYRQRIFRVHQRPSISFSNGCSQSNPLKILKNGRVGLPITYFDRDVDDSQLHVRLSFEPHPGSSLSSWDKKIDVPTRVKAYNYEVKQAGIYTIRSVSGTACEGSVLEPAICVVEELPMPHATVRWNALAECAGDVGVQAELSVTGTPPFEIQYESHRKGYRKQVNKWRFDGVKSEFKLTPPEEGDYTWTVTELNDANYKNIPIKAESHHLMVHPSADISIVNQKKGPAATIWTCAQQSTSVEFELVGSGPFEIDYIIAWGTGSETKTASYQSSGRYSIDIQVPSALLAGETGQGTFSVTFATIKDSKDCVTRPRRATVSYEVKTTHPSARFEAAGAEALALVEGGSVVLPMRLTGEGDWNVEYLLIETDGTSNRSKNQIVTVKSANVELRVSKAGSYQLLSVHDKHCPGSIVDSADTILVKAVARPAVTLDSENLEIISGRKSSYRRNKVCAGDEDQVLLHFTGAKPFAMQYKHVHDLGKHTSAHTSVQELKSAQDTGVLYLSSAIGKHTYIEEAIGDSVYALSSKTSGRTPAFSLEQVVYGRPSASIQRRGLLQYCQDEKMVKSESGGVAVIHLQGEAPFSLELEIGLQGSKTPYIHSIDHLTKLEWEVSIPELSFEAMGTYTLRIRSMSDASGCPFELGDDETTYTSIHVIERPDILAATDRRDLCIGDTLDFVLQGTAPWIVSYEWDGKKHEEQTSQAQFSRLAESAGKFEITGIQHGKAKCKTHVTTLSRRVHALPSAEVLGESQKVKNLHQGDETAIDISFNGQPPFTFTYTRSLPSGKKNALVVVDTQTIAGVMDYSYTIYASQEGTYRVTYVADSLCSFPRIPPVTAPGRKLLMNE